MKNIYISPELEEFYHHHEVVFDAVLMLTAMSMMGLSYHWNQDSLDLIHQPALSYSLMVGYTITTTLYTLRFLGGLFYSSPREEGWMIWLARRVGALLLVVFFSSSLVIASAFAIYIIVGWLGQLVIRLYQHRVS